MDAHVWLPSSLQPSTKHEVHWQGPVALNSKLGSWCQSFKRSACASRVVGPSAPTTAPEFCGHCNLWAELEGCQTHGEPQRYSGRVVGTTQCCVSGNLLERGSSTLRFFCHPTVRILCTSWIRTRQRKQAEMVSSMLKECIQEENRQEFMLLSFVAGTEIYENAGPKTCRVLDASGRRKRFNRTRHGRQLLPATSISQNLKNTPITYWAAGGAFPLNQLMISSTSFHGLEKPFFSSTSLTLARCSWSFSTTCRA